MKMVPVLLLVGLAMGMVVPAQAQLVTYYYGPVVAPTVPLVTPTVPLVTSSNYGYGPTPTVARYATTASYAPAVVAPAGGCCGGSTVNYAPAAPVTTYYAPAEQVVSYYAPVTPVTTYYAPAVPVTTYYAPAVTTAYYAPTISYYAPATVGWYRPTVPGQPVRNLFRRPYPVVY